MIDGSWSVLAEGPMEDPRSFAVEEIASFFRDAAGIAVRTGPGGKAIALRVTGNAVDRRDAESYTLRVTEDRITIEARSWRGVLYGVYYLEQILLDRGAPALRPGEIRVYADGDPIWKHSLPLPKISPKKG